jgi:hypothetical protein
MTGRLYTFIERTLETWIEFLKQRHVSASQLFSYYFMKPTEEAAPELPWEHDVEHRREGAVRLKIAYLQDLGCMQPECHGSKGHNCSLGDDERVFLRVLELYRSQEVPLLRAMRDRLPEELIAKTLAEVVVNNTDGVINLILRSPEDLQRISNSILSDQIPEATRYRPLLERTILETLPIRLDVTFESDSTDREVVARLSDFALSVLPHIRTLVLCVGIEESLSEVSSGLMSLRSQLLPFRLHEFVVEIITASLDDLLDGTNGLTLMKLVLGTSRLEASGKRVTFREDCEALVEAVRSAGIGRAQYLGLDIVPWDHHGSKAAQRSSSWTAITSRRSAAEIVECAVRKDLG